MAHWYQLGTNAHGEEFSKALLDIPNLALVKARPAMSYSLQTASPIEGEIALVAEDLLAVGYVLPGQPASRFATQTTAPRKVPGGSDSRRFYDRDGIRVYLALRREHARVPLSVQRLRTKVGSQSEPSWGPPRF
jgi:hypothetical protein